MEAEAVLGGKREVQCRTGAAANAAKARSPGNGRWRFLIRPSHVQRRGAVDVVEGALCELGAAVVGFEVPADVDGEGALVGVVVVAEGEQVQQLDRALAVAQMPGAVADGLSNPAVDRFDGARGVCLVRQPVCGLLADARSLVRKPGRRRRQCDARAVFGVDGGDERASMLR